mgnify:CR=1 FL=1
MGYQSITVVGNVGKEPELRYTTNGTAVCTFSIAVNEKFGDSESVEWFTIVAWQKLAETLAEHVTKGKELLVVGRMKTRSWDKNDGSGKAYRTELIVRDFSFVGKKDAGGGGGDNDPDDLPFE